MANPPPESGRATIRVAALGSAADALGWRERAISMPAGATLSHLVARLEGDCPRLAEARGRVRYAIGDRFAEPSEVLRDGDEVAIIPPVSGGAPDAPVLMHAPIDVAGLLAEVSAADAGAQAVFVGVVRAERNAQGTALWALDYSAHEPLARARLLALADLARERFGLCGVRVVHRLGRLSVGEASVAVVVSSPHRAESMDGCRWLIEQLKADVPIFKREIWDDGGETWVDPL